jgi:hypothetical protein
MARVLWLVTRVLWHVARRTKYLFLLSYSYKT